MTDIIRTRMIKSIEDYLENECCFRDYEIKTEAEWRDGNEGPASMNLLRPNKQDLDDALNVFTRNGYRVINIYV